MGMSLALGAEVCGSGTPGPRTAVSVVTLPGPSCCRATGLCCATSAPRVLRTFRISGPGLAGCESEAACLDCGGTVGRAVPEHARAGLQRGHISVAISTRAAISPRRFGWQTRLAPRTRTCRSEPEPAVRELGGIAGVGGGCHLSRSCGGQVGLIGG